MPIGQVLNQEENIEEAKGEAQIDQAALMENVKYGVIETYNGFSNSTVTGAAYAGAKAMLSDSSAT